MKVTFSNDGSGEITPVRLCIGNCAPKAIAARRKRSIAILHAYVRAARLGKDSQRGTRNGCLLGLWSVYQLGVPPGFSYANRRISAQKSKRNCSRSGKPAQRLRPLISWFRRFFR